MHVLLVTNFLWMNAFFSNFVISSVLKKLKMKGIRCIDNEKS